MRTSRALLAAALIALLATAAEAGSKARSALKFESPQAAFEQGLGAYKTGDYEIAIPALEEAVAKGSESNRFFAEFYLARIYSDSNGQQTDHAKAYMLFQKLADENADADPDEGHRAPFVAKALTALADYLRRGVPDLRIEPDLGRAIEYLQNAATSFGDQSAQFELAKIYLSRGGSDDVKLGKHFLSVLAKDGNASAQAYLADLYWRGRFVRRDEQRALALSTVAAENAPSHERMWIEDVYLSVYCNASPAAREQADAVVATWRQLTGRLVVSNPAKDGREAAQRTGLCSSGEVVAIPRAPTSPGSEPSTAAVSSARPVVGSSDLLQGNTASFGLTTK